MRKVVLLKGSVKISENWWESGDLNIGYAPDKQTNSQFRDQDPHYSQGNICAFLCLFK